MIYSLLSAENFLSFEQKLQLKLDCEKEIKEAIVQIRQKYEAKLKEKEAEFLLHRTELSETYNKVLMHKILAEAFRSKCMDNMASGSAGTKKGESYSYLVALVTTTCYIASLKSTC